MKLKSPITINDKLYPRGATLPWYKIYPFFLVHMLGFGLSGFIMAYSNDGPAIGFLYLHGGFAILFYTVFYVALFGVDEIKWMFINAALGLLGIYAQIDLILSLFGKKAGDFSVFVHVIPFLYYILYTFLLYQLVLDVTGARDDPHRKRIAEAFYIVSSVIIYSAIYLTKG